MLENIATELAPQYKGRIVVEKYRDCTNCPSSHTYSVFEKKGLIWTKENQIFAVNFNEVTGIPGKGCSVEHPDVVSTVHSNLGKYAAEVGDFAGEAGFYMDIKGQQGHSWVCMFPRDFLTKETIKYLNQMGIQL